MGVAYYANYFVWFEVARTEYLRALGLPYTTIEQDGIYLMVASASCKYLKPARYDDLVRVETWITGVKSSSMTFGYELFIGTDRIATGESVHVATDRSKKPVRIPEPLRRLIAPQS